MDWQLHFSNPGNHRGGRLRIAPRLADVGAQRFGLRRRLRFGLQKRVAGPGERAGAIDSARSNNCAPDARLS